MSENEILFFSLREYLLSIGAEKKATIPNRFSVWYDHHNALEIMLPAEELINHEQSIDLLSEAIANISRSHGFEVNTFINKLLHDSCDFLQVRSSGKLIEHGRINFHEGLNALTGLYGLIKSSANKNIKTKGKKREAVNKYLSSVKMLAPKAGSFIYTVEFGLVNIDEEKEESNILEKSMSLGRYVNSNLAIMLARVSEKIKSDNYESPAKLLAVGIDSSFCDNFLNLFSSKSDSLEFNFDWSFKEVSLENVPDKVAFSLNDRIKIENFKSILSKSKTKKYTDLPAYIEKYSWPIDNEKGRVYLRLEIDGKDYSCFIETESELYETLKAEHAKKQISITSDILITSGKTTTIDILKLYSIKLNENMEIELER